MVIVKLNLIELFKHSLILISIVRYFKLMILWVEQAIVLFVRLKHQMKNACFFVPPLHKLWKKVKHSWGKMVSVSFINIFDTLWLQLCLITVSKQLILLDRKWKVVDTKNVLRFMKHERIIIHDYRTNDASAFIQIVKSSLKPKSKQTIALLIYM